MEQSAAAPSVCAVFDPASARLDAAVAAQRPPPDAVVGDPAPLRERLERALAGGADWIWVLDGSTVPREGALAALLEALERASGLEEPSLMTGAVVTPDGQVDEGRVLWYRRNQIDIAMEAAAQRILPIRAATGSVLVERDAVRGELPPPGAPGSPATVLEWTARILRFRTGYLVPESESEAVEPGYDPAASPLVAARLMFAGALGRFDRLRYGFELAERLGGRSLER